jgi:hypothetical protein
MDLSADVLLLIRVVLREDSREGSYDVLNMPTLWAEKQNCTYISGKIILENNIPF